MVYFVSEAWEGGHCMSVHTSVTHDMELCMECFRDYHTQLNF
jgi:hypothetical protein